MQAYMYIYVQSKAHTEGYIDHAQLCTVADLSM